MIEYQEAIDLIDRFSRLEAMNDSSLEYDDLRSSSILAFWKARDKVKSMDEGGHPVAFFRRLVANVAKKQRIDSASNSCQYTYRSSDVRAMLTTALQGPIEKSVVPKGVDLNPDDLPDIRSDILICLKELPQQDVNCILYRYYYGDMPPNGSSARKRLDRAVDRLTMTMNNYRGSVEFVGTRRVITNAHANAMIGAQNGGC